MSAVSAQVITSFDHPAVGPEVWSALLATGDTNVAALTWQAQRQWWLCNERPGGLLLIVAACRSLPVAIAPLFSENGMAMNLCPVNTLDFVGDVTSDQVLDQLLTTARAEIPDFAGFRFYFLPDSSRSGELLRRSAGRLGLECFLEDEQSAPFVDLRRAAAQEIANGRTMIRRENQLRREGALEVLHFRDAADVLPQLDEFFTQHIARWADTSTPSSFVEASERAGFRRRTEVLAAAGWLRFSRLNWEGRPIAFHRGTSYRGKYSYGKASFAVELARYSPGTVLLRHLLLDAIAEGADTFELGMGDEAYKSRYATGVTRLQTWGLYPRGTVEDSELRSKATNSTPRQTQR